VEANAEDILEQLRATGQVDEATLAKARADIHAKTAGLKEVDGVIQIPTGEAVKETEPGIKIEIKDQILTVYPFSPWVMTKLLRQMSSGVRGIHLFQLTTDLLQKSMSEEDFETLDKWLDDPTSGVTFDTIETILSIVVEKSGSLPSQPPSVSVAGRRQTSNGSAVTSLKPGSPRKKSGSKTS
jgi:hypothetical protein